MFQTNVAFCYKYIVTGYGVSLVDGYHPQEHNEINNYNDDVEAGNSETPLNM